MKENHLFFFILLYSSLFFFILLYSSLFFFILLKNIRKFSLNAHG